MKGSDLKDLLRREGVVLYQLAESLDMSQQNLSAAFTRDDVKSGLLEKIAQALGWSVGYLYGEAANTVQTATGNNNTQVSGSGNTVTSDGAFLEYVRVKDEQLTMAMKQTSKAQEQMDEVLRLFRKPAESVEDGDQ